MFELDDSSLSHTDIYSNRYSDVGFSPMDFFVTDSLQDMLDIDIRSEVATVLGGNTDITLFNDLPPLELDSPTLNSKYYFNMGQEDNIDLYDTEANSVMVDPSSVMPVLFTTDTRFNKFGMLNFNADSTDSSNLSAANKKSHFSFSPTKINTTGFTNTNHTENKGAIRIRSDLVDETGSKKSKQFSSNLISKNSVKAIVNKPTEKTTFISGNIIVGQRGMLSSIAPSQKPTNKIAHMAKIPTKGPIGYPKPAYSYSCLIAMALKNSRYGCLPVSEIYSFMCEHFPYFKTAPNGWKNSVRHNLSLNKCFEKIEKPPTTSSQRKGCLWAMNPTKISKMDEEVQKWSRKDPITIRRAMVFPDTLEALERGEMKHSFQEEEDVLENDNDTEETEDDEVEGSNSDSGSEAEPEAEPEEVPDIEVDSGEEDDQEELQNHIEREEYTDNSESEDEDGEVNVTDSPIKLGNFKFEIINQIINNQPVELQLLQNKYTRDNETEAKRSRVELQYSYMPQSISTTTPSRRKTPLTHRAT